MSTDAQPQNIGGHIGIMENKRETTVMAYIRLCWGYIGIM